MGVDNGDDGEIDTGDDDDFTVVKIRMTMLTMKTVNGEEGRRVEKKEDNEWRRRKTTNGEERRQRVEKKEDNEWRRRKTTNGEEGRQRMEKKEDNEWRKRKTTNGE